MRIDTAQPEIAQTNFRGKIANIIRRDQPASPPRAPAAGLTRLSQEKPGRSEP